MGIKKGDYTTMEKKNNTETEETEETQETEERENKDEN